MKIPVYIQNAIIRTARYNAEAFKNSEIVRKWLENTKLDEIDKSILNESFIDCCEYGNNIPEEFMEELKKF